MRRSEETVRIITRATRISGPAILETEWGATSCKAYPLQKPLLAAFKANAASADLGLLTYVNPHLGRFLRSFWRGKGNFKDARI
jgi:hypothetical protein